MTCYQLHTYVNVIPTCFVHVPAHMYISVTRFESHVFYNHMCILQSHVYFYVFLHSHVYFYLYVYVYSI